MNSSTNQTFRSPGSGLRLVSGVLDFFIFCTIGTLIIITLYASNDSNPLEASTGIEFLFSLSIVIYLNKELVKGQSPAKRVLGLQIIDPETERPASPIKCLVRNILTLLPVAGMFLPLDKITNTRLIRISRPLTGTTNFHAIILSLLISFSIGNVLSVPFLFTDDSSTSIEKTPSGLNPIPQRQARTTPPNYESTQLSRYLDSELFHLIQEADVEVNNKGAGTNYRQHITGDLYFIYKESLLDDMEYTDSEIIRVLEKRYNYKTSSLTVTLRLIYQDGDNAYGIAKTYTWD